MVGRTRSRLLLRVGLARLCCGAWPSSSPSATCTLPAAGPRCAPNRRGHPTPAAAPEPADPLPLERRGLLDPVRRPAPGRRLRERHQPPGTRRHHRLPGRPLRVRDPDRLRRRGLLEQGRASWRATTSRRSSRAATSFPRWAAACSGRAPSRSASKRWSEGRANAPVRPAGSRRHGRSRRRLQRGRRGPFAAAGSWRSEPGIPSRPRTGSSTRTGCWSCPASSTSTPTRAWRRTTSRTASSRTPWRRRTAARPRS